MNDGTLWQSGVQPIGHKEQGSVPNIYGKIDADASNTRMNFFGEWATDPTQFFSGAFQAIAQNRIGFSDYSSSVHSIRQITFDASRSNAAYGRSGEIVIPTSLCIKFCIRY